MLVQQEVPRHPRLPCVSWRGRLPEPLLHLQVLELREAVRDLSDRLPLTSTREHCIISGMSAPNPTSETVKLSINLFPEEVHVVAKMRAAALRKTLREYFTWLVLEDAERSSEPEIYKV